MRNALLSLGLFVALTPFLSAEEPTLAPPKDAKWLSLFNGKTLDGWKKTEFGGEGDVEVKDGQIVINQGSDASGITYTGKMPKLNYELIVEAQRLEGVDFFAATTFPVGDTYVTFVPGGWAGSVTGISSIDGNDASDNATTRFFAYDDKKLYSFRIRVTDAKIVIYINDKLQNDFTYTGKKLGTRSEVDLSKPLGIATWGTKAAIKTVKLRELSKEEVKQTNELDQ